MMSTIPSLQRHSWSSPTNRQQSPKKRICHCFLIYFMCLASDLYTFCCSSHQLPPLNSYWINRTAANRCITCPLTSAHTLTWWNEEHFRCFKAISLSIFYNKGTKQTFPSIPIEYCIYKDADRRLFAAGVALTNDCCFILLMCSR